jgi:hypothetical protein
MLTGMFFASTMVMVSIALVMAVIVTNIYAKKDAPARCPDWSVRLAARFYPAHYLPDRPRGSSHYKACRDKGPPFRREALSINKEATPFCRDVAPPTTNQHSHDWSVQNASHFYPAHYLPDRPRGSSHYKTCRDKGPPFRREALSVNEEVMLDSAHSMCGCLCHSDDDNDGRVTSLRMTHDTFDFERSEAEWKMLAKFTDRVFFWLFVAMSLFVHISLFVQMVSGTRGAVT